MPRRDRSHGVARVSWRFFTESRARDRPGGAFKILFAVVCLRARCGRSARGVPARSARRPSRVERPRRREHGPGTDHMELGRDPGGAVCENPLPTGEGGVERSARAARERREHFSRGEYFLRVRAAPAARASGPRRAFARRGLKRRRAFARRRGPAAEASPFGGCGA